MNKSTSDYQSLLDYLSVQLGHMSDSEKVKFFDGLLESEDELNPPPPSPSSKKDCTLANLVIADLRTRSDDVRLEFFRSLFDHFCRDCGRETQEICHCENDE